VHSANKEKQFDWICEYANPRCDLLNVVSGAARLSDCCMQTTHEFWSTGITQIDLKAALTLLMHHTCPDRQQQMNTKQLLKLLAYQQQHQPAASPLHEQSVVFRH
jgi:hypothetical protein